MKLQIAVAVVASLSLLACTQSPAQDPDAAALYKAKCAMCHGNQGQGKPPMAPKIAGSAKTSVVLTKGGEPQGEHVKPMASITADQIAALAAYVKALK
jgi:mono/diheme cytochrome c family protein